MFFIANLKSKSVIFLNQSSCYRLRTYGGLVPKIIATSCLSLHQNLLFLTRSRKWRLRSLGTLVTFGQTHFQPWNPLYQFPLCHDERESKQAIPQFLVLDLRRLYHQMHGREIFMSHQFFSRYICLISE